jgi:hypothetical protein
MRAVQRWTPLLHTSAGFELRRTGPREAARMLQITQQDWNNEARINSPKVAALQHVSCISLR